MDSITPTQPKRILLVEDSPTQALMMQILLEGAGYLVTVCDRAVDALEAINEQLPDIIIVDFMLPGMRGDEFAQRLKNNSVTRQIPVLMLTAQEGSGIEVKALDSGTDGFLSKSVDSGILLLRIENMIKRSDFTDEPRAGAVTAVGRAKGGGEEQDLVGIGMDKVRRGAMILFAQRVGQFTSPGLVFVVGGNDGAAQGIVLEQCGVVRRNGE